MEISFYQYHNSNMILIIIKSYKVPRTVVFMAVQKTVTSCHFSIQVDFVINVQDFKCTLGGNSTRMPQPIQTHLRHI